MNTPKKQDMINEINQLTGQIGIEAVNFFRPLVMIVSAVTRYVYLEQQINKVTPRPVAVERKEEDEKTPEPTPPADSVDGIPV